MNGNKISDVAELRFRVDQTSWISNPKRFERQLPRLKGCVDQYLSMYGDLPQDLSLRVTELFGEELGLAASS